MEKRNRYKSKHSKSQKFDTNKKFGTKNKRSQFENNEIEQLKAQYKEISSERINKLSDFPLSKKTLRGLDYAKFTVPTKIQQQSIGLALIGSDILGAAKTGSGKTLAFLIPVLEGLYRLKWSVQDGLGALIISPTRELAYQIFEVLRKVGKFHEFSAGLVIGGKHVREEAERINTTNIVICTPGRLLQHMDETAYFNADNLQMLVLDEADRILDLGFQKTINAIVENLPIERQTLLFSATQTKSVRDLARLSLKEPMYVSVHENAQHSTPTQLQQSYLVCNLEDKISLMWSFVKHHLKTKTLIFLSSCKQVRFVHEVFRRMRPGVPVMCLHGAMKQVKRMAVYDAFVRKQNAVLFATDIAARGLDFPAVNWVLQADCPEDANTYIHRAGRTARYEKDGEALLVLLPTEEEAMVAQLEAKKIPVNKIQVNPKKQQSIQGKMGSLVASDVEMKEFAQRAFMSYLKSVFYMSNKSVFDVTKLDLDAFASSVGLAITPRVRFIERQKRILEAKAKKLAKEKKSATTKSTTKRKTQSSGSETDGDQSDSSDSESSGASSGSDSDSSGSDSDSSGSDSDSAKLNFGKSKGDLGFGGSDEDEDELGDIFRVKKPTEDEKDQADDEGEDMAMDKIKKAKTKISMARKALKKNIQLNTKLVFTEEGEEVRDGHRRARTDQGDDGGPEGGIDIDQAKRMLQEEDKFDKELYRDKIRKKHKEERRKIKETKRKEREEKMGIIEKEPEAVLDNDDDDSGPAALDFLPDPDKIYGPKAGSDSGSDMEDDGWNSADYSSDGESSVPVKRRRTMPESSGDESEADIDSEASDLETGLSLADDEMLALKLLQTS